MKPRPVDPNKDDKGHTFGYFIAKLYDICHFEKDYEPKNYMRHELWKNVSLLPTAM